MDDKVWVLESPQAVTEGEVRPYAITYKGATTVSTPTMEVFSKGAPVTGALAPTANTTSASGNIVSCAPITFPANPNKEYTLAVTAVVDGATQVRKCMFICSKKSDPQ